MAYTLRVCVIIKKNVGLSSIFPDTLLHFPLHMGKYYFMSDSHLGAPDRETSLRRERMLVDWLDEAAVDARAIYLLGDIFDFWFDYRHVVPRGHVRLLGKLAELSDKGITIHMFTGNHDMWSFGYFEQELGISLHKKPIEQVLDEKLFLIGHGDGLGPGDYGYKFLKRAFSDRILQRFFAFLHPAWGVGLAQFFSRKSRIATGRTDEFFHGKEKEMLVQFCEQVLQNKPVNFFVFGHRHLPLEIKLDEDVTYINTGDWVKYFSYAVYENGRIQLKYFNQ